MGPRKIEGLLFLMSDVKQVVVVRSDLGMTVGKEDAQCSHASGAFVFRQLQRQLLNNRKAKLTVTLSAVEREWVLNSYAKIVVVAHTEEELLEIYQNARDAGLSAHKIIDAGRTHFSGVPTLTCIALGPDHSKRFDKITGHLKLR